MVNGSPCGKRHSHLLHGSGNSYCNSVKRVLTSNTGVPNVLGKDAPGTPTIGEIEAKQATIQALQELESQLVAITKELGEFTLRLNQAKEMAIKEKEANLATIQALQVENKFLTNDLALKNETIKKDL